MTEITRGEFDMLKQQVSENARRIDTIDLSGTRGVNVVQVQLTDLAKDVARLSTRMDKHDSEHELDAAERIRSRRAAVRWTITTVIALLAIVEGPLLYLVTQTH